jgi:hypothetical protein
MAFTTYYTPPLTGIAQAGYTIGSGQQQQNLNTQQIQKNQFAEQEAYRQRALAEQARQFDTQLAEGVRQFDTSTGIQQEQFGAQQQLAQREVAQRGFLSMAGMWNQNQQLQTEIEARERMAMFNRTAQLEQMGYGASLEAASRLYGMEQQVNLQQQMQQREQEAQLQHLNQLKSTGQISDMDFAIGQAQLRQQAMGIQTQDPTVGMDPMMKEQYRNDMASMQAKETERMTIAQTTKPPDYWHSQGLTYDPRTGQYDDIPVKVHELKRESEMWKYEFDAKVAAEKEAKEQRQKFNEEVNKKMQETIPTADGVGTKLRYPTYEEAYNAAFKIFGNMTGSVPPQPGVDPTITQFSMPLSNGPKLSKAVPRPPVNAMLDFFGFEDYETTDPTGKKANVSGSLMPSAPAPTPAPNLTEWRAQRAALLAK